MKLGIMQPYFFPYIGHFSLISAVDQWIVFDISQYTPKSWMNRNRILHPKQGWQYITIPLSNSSISIKTNEAKILEITKAKINIFGKLSHYKKKAPYFSAVNDLIQEIFGSCKSDSLVQLNIEGLKSICHYLNIPFKYKVCSDLSLSLGDKLGAGDWALEICSQLGATSYLNPDSGRNIFDPAAFKDRGISLQFAKFSEFAYSTGPYDYEPNLSILDVMMWNSPSLIHDKIINCSQIIDAEITTA